MIDIYFYIIENIYQFLGVLFSIIYVIFSIKENILCWPALIIAAIFNIFAFHIIELPLQIIMQLFFIGTGIYGWYNWKKGDNSGQLTIKSWNIKTHVQWIIAGLVITVALWLCLKQINIINSSPFLDSLMFAFNIIPMYMTGKKILESWLYFIAIDIISGFFYLSTGEFFFCFLFFCYIGFAIHGYRTWQKNKV
ncbi:MAG: hypothetical protein CMD23_04805 [Flavobacteriales bacterium]|nr:hypothetical protein [Flavobacteriales bacterium]|tara:strand:+ start:1848 stop:2429 length:582 start_codon:yes stop_codon:yes gene_type:complete